MSKGAPIPEVGAARVLRPARLKWVALFVCSAAFTAGGALILSEEPSFMAWATLLFFGACALGAMMMLTPGAASLRLEAEGFTETKFWRARRRLWRDCSSFQPRSFQPLVRLVVFDEPGEKGLLAKAGALTAGVTSGLADNYGLTADELADLMNAYRDRAVGRRVVLEEETP